MAHPARSSRPYNPLELALRPGTRLGSYEITAQIGAGGMGEVYRATDTNLKRAVAIKVLPAQSLAMQSGSRGSSAKRKSSRH